VRRWVRDALSGRFTTKQRAKDEPGQTVSETDDYTASLANLRWRCSTMQAVMLEAAGNLDNMVMHRSISDAKLRKVADRLEAVARDTIPDEKG